MLGRCENPKSNSYEYYGARGISVCPQWHEFTNFLVDMGEAPPDLTIERKDNDVGYEPNNCCWASWKEQRRNQRRNKK